ncbi:haloalkane dehalogenase [Jannaschia sp. CCS1]|uniref:haloalkane dehalogenase n=1 Tax=Jannaschia sp. (strain CCS1) TaxID=290400 RepID=UPI000053A447|nr:haloalkane dehalogenase [Jannaschia sp. CCS1]ABD55537.1 alpha/beta hydrolase [Jannaschia sp. CCS1]
MKRIRALATAATLAAGLAMPVAAQDTGGAQQPISAEFPFELQTVEVLGSNMAYVDTGDGPVVLFIHGNPTSSYLWRNVIPHVAEDHRAIAIDLIGMGASDKPDIDYTFQDHYAHLEGFIDALELTDITLVLHDWGGGLGTYYAANNSDNVRAIAMMEAAAPPALPIPDWAMVADQQTRETFQAFRDPVMGPQIILEQNGFVEGLLPATILRTLSDAEMDAYRAPFPTPESRQPVLMWPNEIPIEGTPARNVTVMEEVAAWLTTSEQPKLILYASPGLIWSPEVADFAARTFNNTEARFVGAGIHFIQEDQPEAIGRNLSDWLRDRVTRGN